MFFFALALAGLVIFFLKDYKKVPVSKLGEYQGFSQPIYKKWHRISQYITVRDCTDLAVDIFRPTESGKVVDNPLPVIWTYSRYHRASIRNGRTVTLLEKQPWLETVIKHGYVIAVVDIRGGGASFGMRREVFAEEEMWDAYDITEWFAAQPWSNGRIGLFGRSYMGINQYLAASKAPPHLVAIFPEMAMFDFYSFTYPGGVFRHDYTKNWSQRVKDLDRTIPASPVAGDTTGAMLANAVNEHQTNRDVFEMFARLVYRNSSDELTKTMPFLNRSPANYIKEVKKSGIPVYHLSGWYDMWPRDAVLWFNN